MAHADTMFVSGIVLAAGAATRMGRPKQLMPIGRRSMLQTVLDHARESRLDEIVVVLGAHADEVAAALEGPPARSASGSKGEASMLRVVVNEDFAAGLSSSLRCGLRASSARAQAAAILLGDELGVDAVLIDRVLDAFADRRMPLTRPIFRTSAGNAVPGHPVVLSRAVWSEVEALRGDQGARVLFTRDPDRVCEITIAGEPPVDVDTPADYRRAIEGEHAASHLRPS
jgi:molybdenum cofactor cytidylyltransferase